MISIPARFLLCFCCLAQLASVPAAEGVLSKNGRLRATPAIEADNTICRLPSGTVVSIVARSTEDAEWFQVRMPREAFVWVHGTNLVETEDERVRRCTLDGAKMRLDSRQQAREIGSLRNNELVTLKGMEHGDMFIARQVGDWYAVHVPRLLCYVHESVLTVRAGGPVVAQENAGAGAGEAGEPGPVAAGGELDQLWAKAQEDYEAYRQVLERSNQQGLQQNWQALLDDLRRIVDQHPHMRTRLLADKMHTQVRQMLYKAQLLAKHGLVQTEIEPEPGEAAISRREGAESGGPVITVPPEVRETPPVEVPVVAEPGEGEQPAATTVVADTAGPPAVGAGSQRVQGWLFEEQVPELAVHHVLKAQSGDIIALLQVAPGSAIQLSDFVWKQVRIQGEGSTVTGTIEGRSQQALLIKVGSIDLVD